MRRTTVTMFVVLSGLALASCGPELTSLSRSRAPVRTITPEFGRRVSFAEFRRIAAANAATGDSSLLRFLRREEATADSMRLVRSMASSATDSAVRPVIYDAQASWAANDEDLFVSYSGDLLNTKAVFAFYDSTGAHSLLPLSYDEPGEPVSQGSSVFHWSRELPSGPNWQPSQVDDAVGPCEYVEASNTSFAHSRGILGFGADSSLEREYDPGTSLDCNAPPPPPPCDTTTFGGGGNPDSNASVRASPLGGVARYGGTVAHVCGSSGGGGGGGSDGYWLTVTECWGYDYFDDDGNYLFSEIDGCDVEYFFVNYT